MAYTATAVWNFAPNWGDEVLERLEWRTSAMISEIGAEQRIPLRLTPRRTFEASFLIQKENRQYFQHLTGRNGASDWLIPLWHQVTGLGAAANSGTDTLTLDTRWREYKVGDMVILRNRYDARIWEAIEIESVTDSTLILISNLEKTWPKGTFVYPARLAKLQDMVAGSKKTDELFEVKMQFSISEKNPYASEWTPDSTYQGAPVFDQRPDDSEDLTFEFKRYTSIVDNELGLPDLFDVAGRPFRKMQYRWSFAGRESNHEFRQFLYYLKGRFRSVWIPTFMADLTIAANVVDDDDNITIKRVSYFDSDIVDLPWKDIRIEMRDGTVAYHHIVASSVIDADTEQIGLETPIAEGFTIAEVARISYMMKVRLDQDSIEINHAADTEGLTQTVVTWYELAADIPVEVEEEPEDWGDLWLTSVYDLDSRNELTPTDLWTFMEEENQLLIPFYTEYWDEANETFIYGVEWRRHSADDFTLIDTFPPRLTEVTVANPSGTVTRMTKTGHGLSTGNVIFASEFSSWLNGAWTITVVDANSFNLDGAVWQATADASGIVTRFTDDWDTDGGEFIDDPDGYVWLCAAYSANTYRIDKTTWAFAPVERLPVSIPVGSQDQLGAGPLTSGYYNPIINPYNNDVYMADLDAYGVMHRVDKSSATFQPAQSYFMTEDNIVLTSPYSGVVDTAPYYDGPYGVFLYLGDVVFVSATEAYMNDYVNSNIFHIDLTTGVFTYVFRLVNGAGSFSQHHPLYYDGPTNTLWFYGTNNSWYEMHLGTPVLTAGSLRSWTVGADPSTIIDYPLMWDHEMVVDGTVGDQDGSELGAPTLSVDKFNRGVWIGYGINMAGGVVDSDKPSGMRFFSFVDREITKIAGDDITPTPGFKGSFAGTIKITSVTTGWCYPSYVWNAPSGVSSVSDGKIAKMTYSAARTLDVARYVRITIYGSGTQARNATDYGYMGLGGPVGLQEIEVHSELGGVNVAVGITATSSASGFPVSNLLDEDLLDKTHAWRANTVDYPQVLTIDLGSPETPVFEVKMWPINSRIPGIGGYAVTVYPEGAYIAPAIFDIDISVDGSTWVHKRRYQGITAWACGIDVAEDPPAARVFQAF